MYSQKSQFFPSDVVFADPFGDARIAVVALSVFFMMTIHTMGAVQNVEGIYILAGRYGAHGLKLFFKVILPGSLPSIFSGMRVALGMALIVIIAVEFLRAEGVGYLIYYNWEILPEDVCRFDHSHVDRHPDDPHSKTAAVLGSSLETSLSFNDFPPIFPGKISMESFDVIVCGGGGRGRCRCWSSPIWGSGGFAGTLWLLGGAAVN